MSDQQPEQEAKPKEKQEDAPPPKSNGRRRVKIIILSLILIGAVIGARMWYNGQVHISTDDAFIEGHIHTISPRITGHVVSVLVDDNQRVEKGDLLVELDPAPYQVKVQKAAAELAMAQNTTSGDYAQVAQAEASVHLAQARLDQANIDLQRGKALFGREVIPKEQLDRLETARKVAASQLTESQEALRKAKALLGKANTNGQEARIALRLAELDEARLNLSYTQICAPTSGHVTRKSVEQGNNVQPGQPLLSLVQLSDTWIIANYKESQLTHMHPGQEVDFTVDAYPGQDFKGVVDSIMAGTGAVFSLLPPENATGNYVKVVQRVPVKIHIDPTSDPKHVLRVGMSVVPTVHTGISLKDILAHLNPF